MRLRAGLAVLERAAKSETGTYISQDEALDAIEFFKEQEGILGDFESHIAELESKIYNMKIEHNEELESVQYYEIKDE